MTNQPVRVMFEHAGFSYPSGADKAGQLAARRANARRLARSLERALELGWSIRWQVDPDVTSHDWEPDTAPERQTWLAELRDESGFVLASLGGVDFGDSEPCGHYATVVFAELADESLVH